mgnify:CR=1 FL=1
MKNCGTGPATLSMNYHYVSTMKDFDWWHLYDNDNNDPFPIIIISTFRYFCIVPKCFIIIVNCSGGIHVEDEHRV